MKMASLLLAVALAAFATAIMAANPALAEIVPTLTHGTPWKKTAAIPVQFQTFHPQGMVKIGDDFFFSSVDIGTPTKRFPQLQDGYDCDAGESVGYLFKMDKTDKVIAKVQFGEGSMYRPGGIDFGGRYICVLTAEYRPNRESIIYRVDPQTMQAEEMFRFKDHVGAIVHNLDDKSLHGVSRGSRRLYAWSLDAMEN